MCLPGGRWAGSLSAGHLSSAAMNKIIHQAVAPPQRRLFSKPCTTPKPTQVFLFMPRPLIYHVSAVSGSAASPHSPCCCRFPQTISDNLRMLSRFSVLYDFFWGGGGMWSLSPGGIISCVIILYYTMCKETRGEHERPVALSCERWVVVGEQEWAQGIRRLLYSTCAIAVEASWLALTQNTHAVCIGEKTHPCSVLTQ